MLYSRLGPLHPQPVWRGKLGDGREEKEPSEEEIQQNLPGDRGVYQHGRRHKLRWQTIIKVRLGNIFYQQNIYIISFFKIIDPVELVFSIYRQI